MGSYLELVEGSGAGETFADVADLQMAMRRMLEDAARRREMSVAAYARFRATFSEDVVVPNYLEIVHRFLSRRTLAASFPVSAAPAHV